MSITRRQASMATIILSAIAFLPNQSASAAPVQWPIASGGNGHHYEFVTTKTTWGAAQADAQSRTHLGVAGHLATISNAAENEFVRSLVTDNSELFWLGLFVTSPNPRDFVWVDAPISVVWRGERPADGGLSPNGAFTNWETNEPNNAGGGENWTIMYTENGRWNDTLFNRLGDGGSYVVEYNVVPEPGTAGLMWIASMSLAHVVRRRILRTTNKPV
jgi:hypothetical protein